MNTSSEPQVRSLGLGWKPQLHDKRDLIYSAPRVLKTSRPRYFDLRSHMPKVIYDQGQTSSCVANAVAKLMQFARMKEGLSDAGRVPSRLMLYYMARLQEGPEITDSGCYIRDAIKAAVRFGACFEDGLDGWGFDPSKVNLRPSDKCFDAALKDKAIRYMAVLQTSEQICTRISEGFPIAFGATYYKELDSAEVAKTGRLPMPAKGDDRPIGGHATDLCGYDEGNRTFLACNSWGEGWGLKGYFMLPFDYVLGEMSSDFQTIEFVG